VRNIKRQWNGEFAPKRKITREDIKNLFGKIVLTIAVASFAQIITDAFSEYEPIIVQEYVYKVKEVEAKAQPVNSGKQDIVKKVAENEGVDWKILWAICKVETGCINKPGDGGKSYGAFQIHLPSHPDITPAQANNFEWAATWTAQHLKKYKDDPSMAFKCHNGIGKTSNQWYIDRCLKVYNSL